MFLTSLKQICNEYLIKFSENQSAPKLENRKTSPCSPCAPNLLHVLMSRTTGYHNLCSPALVKVKAKFAQTEVYKDSPLEKIAPLRSNPAPSPTVPLLHCPHGPSMPRFSPPLQTLHPSDNQGRASTSHVGGLAALLVLKVVLIGKGTRTLLDVDKDCDDGGHSSSGWLV